VFLLLQKVLDILHDGIELVI